MTRASRSTDVVLSVVVLLVSFVFSYGPGTLRMSLSASLAVSALAASAVWLSGRAPGAALAAVAVLAVGLPAARSTFEAFDLVVVVVVVRVLTSSAVSVWAAGLVCLAALTVGDVWHRLAVGRSFDEPSILYPAILTAFSVGVGMQARRIRRQQEELAALRESEQERVVADERRRIAYDLHDVAAQHLSALVVRNTLARRLGTPDALAEAAKFTATTTTEALVALRQVVGVLGAGGGPELTPAPGMDELDRIVARMEGAGLRVSWDQAPVDPVPDAVAVAVVRIVQEALANVLRHRGPGRCWLDIQRRDDELVLVVEDDGAPTAAAPLEGREGIGMTAMRERARSCGGQLSLEASSRGGWAVRATLPVGGTAADSA
ncbi:MAG: sensor histidine kinase [Phycicoccus sp.]